jgi:hypothetical protein
MGHAQRYREGIGISREVLERGVRQALVCMELGLQDVSAGDLNAAVDCLASGDLEALRKRGWELAFFRLEEMRERCTWIVQRPGAGLLGSRLKQVRRWSRISPETWTFEGDAVDPDEDCSVDPIGDHADLAEIKGRMDFLDRMPPGTLEDLFQAAGSEASFDGLLRNLVLSLALELQVLVPNSSQVSEFESRCFDGGQMVPKVRESVLEQTHAFLADAVEDEAVRAAVLAEIHAEISHLESAAEGGLSGLLTLGEES